MLCPPPVDPLPQCVVIPGTESVAKLCRTHRYLIYHVNDAGQPSDYRLLLRLQLHLSVTFQNIYSTTRWFVTNVSPLKQVGATVLLVFDFKAAHTVLK